MKMGRIAAIVLALATVGILTGGAMAMVAITPVSTTPPVVPTVTYMIPPTSPHQLAMFAPFVGVVMGLGLVQIHLVSFNGLSESYQLRGTTTVITVPADASVTVLLSISHPGQYDWVTPFPSSSSPNLVVVGILDVAMVPT